jgi:hypothetical protein
MNAKNDGNMLGRVAALALIVGVAYGAHAISRGLFDCGMGTGGCCLTGEHHDADHDDDHEAGAKDAPAKMDADSGAVDEDAKLEAKAPVVPPATTK